jgi:hypothetical protein
MGRVVEMAWPAACSRCISAAATQCQCRQLLTPYSMVGNRLILHRHLHHLLPAAHAHYCSDNTSLGHDSWNHATSHCTLSLHRPHLISPGHLATGFIGPVHPATSNPS